MAEEIYVSLAILTCAITFSDLNECSTNVRYCDVNALCNNTLGSYTCTCKAGYSGDGRTCTGRQLCYYFALNINSTVQSFCAYFLGNGKFNSYTSVFHLNSTGRQFTNRNRDVIKDVFIVHRGVR